MWLIVLGGIWFSYGFYDPILQETSFIRHAESDGLQQEEMCCCKRCQRVRIVLWFRMLMFVPEHVGKSVDSFGKSTDVHQETMDWKQLLHEILRLFFIFSQSPILRVKYENIGYPFRVTLISSPPLVGSSAIGVVGIDVIFLSSPKCQRNACS